MAKKKEEFLLDPANIPGVDYYLEGLKSPNGRYPKRANHAKPLTVEGFCKAANSMIGPFGKALKKARILNAER